MAVNRPGPVSLRERVFFDRSKPVRSFIARWATRLGIPAAAGLIAYSQMVPALERMAPFISNIDSQTSATLIIGLATAALAGIKSILVGRAPKQLSAPNTPVAVAKPVPFVPPPGAVAPQLAAVVPPPAVVVPPPPPRRVVPPPSPAVVAAPRPAASARELFDQGQFTQAFGAADMAKTDEKGILDEINLRRNTLGRVLLQIEQLKSEGKFTEAAWRLEQILNGGLLVSVNQVPKIKAEIDRLRSNPREGEINLTEEIDVCDVENIGKPEAFEATMLSQIPLPPVGPLPPAPVAPAPAPVPAPAPAPSAPTTVPPAPAGTPAGSSSGATTVGGQMDLFIQSLKNDAVRQQLILAGNNKRELKKIMESLSGEEIAGIESQFDAAYELVAQG
jgi:hypothetical protein